MRDASNKDPHLAEEFRLMIDRPTASPTILQPRSSKWDSSTNIRTDPAWPQNTATLSCTSGTFSHSVRSLILWTLEDTGWLIGGPDGGRQSSIRFDPFSYGTFQSFSLLTGGPERRGRVLAGSLFF